MSKPNPNRVTIDDLLVEKLKEEAERNYHDLSGFVNYLLRAYLIGDLVKIVGTQLEPKEKVEQPVTSFKSEIDNNPKLPDAIDDIDLGA